MSTQDARANISLGIVRVNDLARRIESKNGTQLTPDEVRRICENIIRPLREALDDLDNTDDEMRVMDELNEMRFD